MLNRITPQLALFAAACLLTAAPAQAMHGGHKPDPQKRADKMAKKLDLTDEQKARVIKMLEELDADYEQLRQRHDVRLLDILNDEQDKMYKEMQEKREKKMEKMKERRERREKKVD